MAITELKILKYECKNCLHDWTMINPGKDWRTLEDAGYFCPYCGKKQSLKNKDVTTEANWENEGGGSGVALPFVDDNTPRKELDEATRMPMSAPIIVQKQVKKPVRVLEAEDRITQARCPDGGWWNPITKKCQGEGVGHNVEELDNDPTL